MAAVMAVFLLPMGGCEGDSEGEDGDVEDSRDTADQTGEDAAPDAPSDRVGDADIPSEGESGDGAEDLAGENPRALADVVEAAEAGNVPGCLGTGCQVSDSAECCSGLEPAADCLPGDECTPDAQYCIRCGDSFCGAHENPVNCPEDCPQQCGAGSSETVSCMGTSTACTCVQPDCIPKCLFAGTESEGWYYVCEGGEGLIAYTACSGESAECGAIGSYSEGWYASGSAGLIEWQLCHNRWICE